MTSQNLRTTVLPEEQPPSRFVMWQDILFFLVLLVVAAEIRGQRLVLGPFSFYWTTARLLLALSCAGSLPWFLREGYRRLLASFSSLVWTSLGFWVVSLVATAMSSYPAVAFERFIFYSMFLYLFWLGLAIAAEPWRQLVPVTVFILGLIEAVLGILEFFIWDVKEVVAKIFVISGPGLGMFFGPHEGGRLHSCGTFQNPIIFGAFCVIALIYGWIKRPAFSWRILIPASAILATAVVVSGSRLAVLGLCLAIVIKVIESFLRRRMDMFIVIGLTAGVLGAMVIYEAPPKLGSAIEQFRLISSRQGFDQYSSGRLMIWKSALAIWKDHPWIGVGPGVYDRHLANYPQYQFMAGEFSHPHNLILRILCETGIIGMSAFAVFFAVLWRQVAARGWALSPLIIFVLFEMFEEFFRDAFPSLLIIVMIVYAIGESQKAARPVNGIK